jgi:serine-type D-Ala-D-Ala carboxypeptidase (penicillin-binding protein 5/6)
MNRIYMLFFIFIFIITISDMAYANEVLEDEISLDFFSDIQVIKNFPEINAGSAIVMDAKTGRVLYEKNAFYERPMASTTKIMTAILILEYGNLEEIVTVSKHAASIWGSKIHLKTGEKLSLKELLYGILLNSGNDAAIAAAEHISGTEENFIELMNKKAYEIGAYDTCFKSPHGLDKPGHYSTAYDMAIITQYALRNEIFSSIVATKDAQAGDRSLHNTNEMLQIYKYADGVKTGYTGKAGRCLVTSATKEGWKIISVVLYCPSRYARALSSKTILEYAFNNYKNYILLRKGSRQTVIPVCRGINDKVYLEAEEDIILPLNEEEVQGLKKRFILSDNELLAPVKKGQKAGYVEILINDEIIAKSDLIAVMDIRRKGYFDYLMDILRCVR